MIRHFFRLLATTAAAVPCVLVLFRAATVCVCVCAVLRVCVRAYCFATLSASNSQPNHGPDAVRPTETEPHERNMYTTEPTRTYTHIHTERQK